MKARQFLTSAAVVLIAGVLIVPAACKSGTDNVVGQPTVTHSTAPGAIVPYIPPSYYNCIEVLPVDLENAYHTAYGNHAEAQILYDGKIFLFRNLLVDQYMLSELDKGWIWADLTNCPVVNMDYARTLRPGDRIDIVGINLGLNLTPKSVLAFKDCYLLPTGALQLPAPGGATFSPVY
jgi:hypothetical protein